MKEIQPLHKEKDPIVNVAQKEIEKQEKFIGKIKVIKGLKMYKMSTETGKISLVEFEEAIVDYKNPEKTVHKMIQEPRHLYLQALNDKNAKRKFTKMVKKIIEENAKTIRNPVQRVQQQ